MIARRKRVFLAVSLAAGFALFRLIYALIFSGLWGQHVIFDLPQFSLPGPFRQVSLFGPVSTDGITRNIELALPFAIAILVFGLLSALITPSSFAPLGKRLPRLSWLFTTLGVALAAIPALAKSISLLGRSRKLRGETRLSILVPIFERVVTQAMSTALELARSGAEQATGKLVLSEFQAAHLSQISAEFKAGSVVLLTGETGAGKSTFLRALAGEIFESEGRLVTGSVELAGRTITTFAEASKFSYLVPQLPENTLPFGDQELAGEFAKDLVFGPNSALSHGESYRVLIDVALSREPALLLLDEPSAALDSAGTEKLKESVARLSSGGTTVFIAEHRPDLWSDLATEHLSIQDGALVHGQYRKPSVLPVRNVSLAGNELSARVSIAEIGFEAPLLTSVNLELRQGECVAIFGPNGAGKSTLLHRIAWPKKGEVFIHGSEVIGAKPRQIALVPDRPGDFFVTDNLSSELARSDRVAGAAAGLTRLTLESILGGKLDGELATHPLDLSTGTQLALAVSMQLSHKPSLLLMDEPVQGLDPQARELMAETIRCVQETGCAILFATHDREFASGLADLIFEISHSKLVPVGKAGVL